MATARPSGSPAVWRRRWGACGARSRGRPPARRNAKANAASTGEGAAMSESFALVRYDAACRAVAEAKTVDEAREFHDEFKARQAYARQARNRELEADCVDLRFRAARRLGELLEAQRQTIGLAPAGRPKIGISEIPISKPPTLLEAGIDKN